MRLVGYQSKHPPGGVDESQKYIIEVPHMRDPLVTKPVIKLDDIAEDAQFAFWQEVVKHLPLADGGDFDPLASYQFDLMVGQAIRHWWSWNASVSYDLDLGNGNILQGADC